MFKLVRFDQIKENKFQREIPRLNNLDNNYIIYIHFCVLEIVILRDCNGVKVYDGTG
jgi:hypothetical protein